MRNTIRVALLLMVTVPVTVSWATGETRRDDFVLPLPAPTPTETYIVKKGDNDWDLAKRYGITVAQLHKLNPKVDFKKLQIGAKIQVPAKNPPKAAAKTAAKPAVKPAAQAKPASAPVQVPGTGQVAEVIRQDVILRSGPGTSFERRARLNKGQTARVLERRNGWTKVQFASGTAGWMRDDMVSVRAAQGDLTAKKEDAAALPTTPDATTDVATADSAVATQGGDGSSEVSLVANREVVVPPTLPPAEDPRAGTAEAVSPVASFDGKVVRITATNVIVRSGPTTGSDRLVMVNRGRTADILAKQDDWYRVRFSGGTVGWIRQDLLELVSRDLVVKEQTAAQKAVALSPDASKVDKVIALARTKLGTRYVYGASRSNAFDCSGFVIYVMSANGVTGLPRTSAGQSTVGVQVARKDLQKGDLVFFRTTRGNRISHVGIYIGGGNFIHSSSGGGKVQINTLNEGYYNARYVTARRLPALSK